MGGLGRLRLNGNNISIAELSGGAPVNGTGAWCTISSTNAATLTVGSDGNSTEFDGVFADGTNQPLGLTKAGAGTFVVTADSTNTGPVTVNAGTLTLQPGTGTGSFNNATLLAVSISATLNVNGRSDQTLTLNSGQTLKGSGTVSGNVIASPGSIVNPGDKVGTLNVSGSLSLGGTLMLELNRTNTPNNCDRLNATGGVVYGGTLVVTNVGPALQVNDTFHLFSGGVNGFTGL